MPQWASENSGASVSESMNCRRTALLPDLMDTGETLVDGARQAVARQNNEAAMRGEYAFNDGSPVGDGGCVKNIPPRSSVASRGNSDGGHALRLAQVRGVVDVEEQPPRIAEVANLVDGD